MRTLTTKIASLPMRLMKAAGFMRTRLLATGIQGCHVVVGSDSECHLHAFLLSTIDLPLGTMRDIGEKPSGIGPHTLFDARIYFLIHKFEAGD